MTDPTPPKKKSRGVSAVSRSLALLRAQGYTVAVVERWNHHVRIRQDLWGVFDLLAFDGSEIVGVQVKSHAAGDAEENLRAWTAADAWFRSGGTVAVHVWRKTKPRGEREAWRVKVARPRVSHEVWTPFEYQEEG